MMGRIRIAFIFIITSVYSANASCGEIINDDRPEEGADIIRACTFQKATPTAAEEVPGDESFSRRARARGMTFDNTAYEIREESFSVPRIVSDITQQFERKEALDPRIATLKSIGAIRDEHIAFSLFHVYYVTLPDREKFTSMISDAHQEDNVNRLCLVLYTIFDSISASSLPTARIHELLTTFEEVQWSHLQEELNENKLAG